MRQKISVIIPVYKVEAYLDQCVASVVAQSYTNLEIILVDDGSPDRCPQMCDAWAEKDNRIKVIHKTNGGISNARNAGLEIATGDYVAFVDSDDWVDPCMYEKLLAALHKEGADICACNILSCYPDCQQAWGCSQYTVGDSEKILSMLYADTSYPVSVWNKLYRRELWEDIRFPVGITCGEDAMTTCRLVAAAKKIVQINLPLYFYRIRENSIMTSKFSAKRMDEEEAWRYNYQFVQEHYPKLYKLAFDFYLLKVNILLHTIPKGQEAFLQEYQKLKNILRGNLKYIICESQLRLKQRIKLLVDYFTL